MKLLHPPFGPNFREPMGTLGDPEVDMFLVGGNSFFFIFTSTWGRFPFWRAYFFKGVGSTTNQVWLVFFQCISSEPTEHVFFRFHGSVVRWSIPFGGFYRPRESTDIWGIDQALCFFIFVRKQLLDCSLGEDEFESNLFESFLLRFLADLLSWVTPVVPELMNITRNEGKYWAVFRNYELIWFLLILFLSGMLRQIMNSFRIPIYIYMTWKLELNTKFFLAMIKDLVFIVGWMMLPSYILYNCTSCSRT